MTNQIRVGLSLLLCLVMSTDSARAQRQPETFVVADRATDFRVPKIIIQFNPDQNTGFDWGKAKGLFKLDGSDAGRLRSAVQYLQDGIRRISGQSLEIVSSNDLSAGIVLTTLAGAPELATDAEVVAALKNDGTDSYNDREAFFLRSESRRLLIVANTVDGLIAAVSELLESVGYEVLGMGPNWIHVPGGGQEQSGLRPLSFQINRGGRAGFYYRQLIATSGQQYGVGTILNTSLADPADETVDVSYKRWQVGTRMAGMSMSGFPGHALQAFHKPVVERIVKTASTDGFLATTLLGNNTARPAASSENAGALWINTDGPLKAFVSTGTTWNEANLLELGVNLDLSIPFVREIILDEMKRASEAYFAAQPDRVFIFGTDPEDGGGYAVLETRLKNKNWYPEYLAARGITFAQPYVLNGHLKLDQPREIWDASAPSDTVFGFNNWLLREYDLWIDSLPVDRRVTRSGRSKKDLVRCSLYSYNYHDVPPNFNLDPRIRVMIASYPKNRGRGKWKSFVSQQDLARAFQVMLPREPSGDYRILSLSYFNDHGMDNLPVSWSASPRSIQRDLSETYRAGIKALACETDFNFGKFGLAYYLQTKMLWNPSLTAGELDAIRDRWLQRSFGSGWREMKSYYDFMLVENFPVNGPNTWAHAIRLIEAADKRIDPGKEPAAKLRIDDLKQFWYYYYLTDTGHIKVGSPPTHTMKSTDPLAKEFVWKGQMSYMVAQHVITRRTFGHEGEAAAATDASFVQGPAHFTRDETASWWAKVLDHWKETPVSRFADATLADGRKVRDVDLNDLVCVQEFSETKKVQPFVYNSGYMKAPTILNVAVRPGQQLGFQLSWPRDPTGKDGYYISRNLRYGVDFWNPVTRAWDSLIDPSMTTQSSREIDTVFDGSKRHVAEVRFAAPSPGTYRFNFGQGGNLGYLAGLDFDLATGKFKPDEPGAGFSSTSNIDGLTQEPVYIYIPAGTRSLDLEVWDSYKQKTVTLYQSWRGQATLPASRVVDISARQTHRIALQKGEDGSLARIDSNGFAFPFLYSVPGYWSKSPHQLLVPKSIVNADGLTAVKFKPR